MPTQQPQTIVFDALTSVDWSSGLTIPLVATVDSGRPLHFTSSDSSTASVGGTTLSVHKAGTVTITVTAGSNAHWLAASAQQSVTINKLNQTITFAAPASPVAYATATTFSLSATSDSSLSVTVTSSATAVVSISGTTASVQGAGTTVLTASQAGDDNHHAATSVSHTVVVEMGDQMITAHGLETKYVGDAAFTISATSNRLLTSFTATSSNPSVATVAGMTITPVAPGIATILVTEAGNTFYNPAEWEGLLTVKALTDTDSDGVPDSQDDIDTDLTDGSIDQDGDFEVSAADTAGGAKHLRLNVPHYDDNTVTRTNPCSYIHLGAQRTDDDAKGRGDDLLELIGLTPTTTSFYRDDWRKANGQQHPSTVYHRQDGIDDQTKTPQQLTGELMTRGGWREHTDGNRITTTRGDRVEVIGGNYKMVVLGRVFSRAADNGWGQSYWESSGGHNKDGTNTPGEVTSIVWKSSEDDCNDTYAATWKVYDETIKGKVISRYTGNTYEWSECDLIVDTTGSPDSVGLADADCPDIPSADVADAQRQTNPEDGWVMSAVPARQKINPNITETTTATSIKDEIHATMTPGASIDEHEVIRVSKVEETTVTGSITSNTFAGVLSDEKGFVRSKDQPHDGSCSYGDIDKLKETLTCGGAYTAGEFGVLKLEITTGAMHWTNTGMGAAFQIGVTGAITVGLDTSFTLGSIKLAANLTRANSLEVAAHLGAQIGLELVYKTAKDGIGMSNKQMTLLHIMSGANKSSTKAVRKSGKLFKCFL